MLLCKLLWLYGIVLGVSVRALKLTAAKDKVSVNVRQNASLHWTLSINRGETYSRILWGTSTVDSDGTARLKEILFYKTQKDAAAKPFSRMPPRYAGRVKILPAATLFIERVDLSDESFYMCEITTPFLTIRKAINLTVIDPPQILTQLPQQLTWNEGDSKEITCNTDGKPKPRVTWKKDDIVIKQARQTAKLDFPSVTYKAVGLYKCLAENAGGRKQKQVQVNVLYSPKDTNITTDAPQDTVSDGGLITITCKAHGNPTPMYKFFIENRPINDRKAERSGILKLTAMSFSQSGIYSCRPENDRGKGPRKDVAVYVRHAPTITLSPESQVVDENGQVNVRCEAKGYPPPKITWVKVLGNRKVEEGNSLFKRNVQRSDQGRYRCIATNGFGQDATAEFKINVYYSPVINVTASSKNVPAWAGATTNLSCVADGNPAPRYIWTNSSGVVATSEEHGILQVTPQGGSGFGPYTCTVENNKGKDYLDIQLVKVDKPVVKLEFQGGTAFSLSFTLRLLSDDRSNSFLQYYTLRYRKDDGNGWIKKISRISPSTTTYQITDLEPYTEYIVELYATNKHFTSEKSEVRARTTAYVPGPPHNVIVDAINSTAIHVQWMPPLKPNGPLKFYTVSVTGSFRKVVTVMPNVTEAFIGGLDPYTNYSVKVKVENSVSHKESSGVIIRTRPSAPSKPRHLDANTTGPYSVRLTWKKPKKVNGIIVLFKVRMYWRFKNMKGGYKEETYLIPAKVTTRAGKRRFARRVSDYAVRSLEPVRDIELKRVQPFAIISIQVSEGTRNADQEPLWSPFSNNQTIETMEGAPSAPLNVELQEKTATSLLVTWKPPEYPNGIIQGYRIIYSNNTGRNYSTADITKGLQNKTLFYLLSGLKEDREYKIYVQAFTSYPGEVSSPASFNKSPGDVSERSGVDTGSLYGGVFAGIIILAFAIIIVALVIRRRKKRRDSTELKSNRYAVANSNDSGIGDKESLDRVPGIKYLQGRRGSEDVVGPGKFVIIKPIPIEKLRDYCEINHADGNKSFREEFVSIRVPGNFTWESSQKPENKAKNRYKNIIPYDHTRVTLAEVDGYPGSDYINANFIDGYNHHCKFIATQGPVANTFGDFWRTVWDQGVCVIVMVTNIVEGGRIKCLKYWPSASPEMYGPVLVSPGDEEELADYVVRKFSIQMTSDTAEYRAREVTQYHFTAWPDQGVPTHATSLLAFLKKVRASVPEDSGPILIHCSAGVGRTGTYIVLDAMLDQIGAEGVVDIYGFVCHIRQQRSSMVQTEAQYIFIHDALMEYVTCGTTEFVVRELPEKLRILNTVDPDSGDSLLVAEFKNLGLGDCDSDSFITASQPENKTKNRFAILPFDRTRVKLWPYTGLVGSDYINASFVDSFQQREAFIATQAPLDNTVVDFWRMAWEYEAFSIVMLSTLSEKEEGLCAHYLPHKEEFIVYGLLMIEIEAEDFRNGFCRRHLKITNTKSGEIRNLYHFHFTEWAERSIPLNGVGLLDMMKCITRVQQQTGNGPIVVHCSDGSGRTGTFCAINIALERVKLDGTIDMFQAVRRLRTQRPLMVQTAEQYKLCYEMVRLFVDSYSDYANFK
ncbi:receptor-type tyrosine-protein phosphatase S-like [Oculina patagonica]